MAKTGECCFQKCHLAASKQTKFIRVHLFTNLNRCYEVYYFIHDLLLILI